MSISSLGGQVHGIQLGLLSGLRKAGLTDQQAGPPEPGLATSAASRGGSGFGPAKLQAALRTQLEADVKAGTLTQDQSDRISAAFAKLGQHSGGGGGASPTGAGSLDAPPSTLAGLLDTLRSSTNGGTTNQVRPTVNIPTYVSQLLGRGLLNSTV